MKKSLIQNLKKVKRFGAICLASAMLLTLCAGCVSTAEGATNGVEPATVQPGTLEPGVLEPITVGPVIVELGTELSKVPGDEIILLSCRCNAAWGYENHGFFVTANGSLFKYDFSQDGYPMGDSPYEYMKIMAKTEKPDAKVDTELLEEIYEYGMQIDPSAEMKVEHEACDYGENMIIFRNPETDEWITCYEQGDSTGYKDDKYAKKLADLWGDEWMDATEAF